MTVPGEIPPFPGRLPSPPLSSCIGSSLSFALQVRSGEAAEGWRRRRRRRARETFPSLPAFVVPPPRTTTAPPLPPLRALDGFLYHPGAAAAAAAAAAGGSLRRDGRSGGRETGSPGSSPLAVICKSLGGQQQNNCVSSPHKGTGWEEYSWGAKNLPLPSFVSRGWCELFGPAPPIWRDFHSFGLGSRSGRISPRKNFVPPSRRKLFLIVCGIES